MLSYLLESAVCLVSFYALYGLLLRRETFFFLNRAYLVLAPVLSLLLPALHFQHEWSPVPALPVTARPQVVDWRSAVQEAQAVPAAVVQVLEQPVTLLGRFSAAELLLLVYGIGVALLLVRLLGQLARMYLLLRRCRKIDTRLPDGESARLAVSEHESLPLASFLGYIFWDLSEKPDENRQLILLHELAHVRQRHSLDVLLLELLLIAQWFNPLMYAFRRSLRAVHEYLADEYVVRRTRQRYAYASLLVQQQTGFGASPGLFNTFHSLTKHRLLMLAKHPSRPLRRAKYLLALPLFAVLCGLFSFRLVETLPAAEPLRTAAKAADALDLSLHEVTVLGKSLPAPIPEAIQGHTIFYWCGSQCTLEPVLNGAVLRGTLSVDPLTFSSAMRTAPYLWDGHAIVSVFDFELRHRTFNVDSRHPEPYERSALELQSWAQTVKPGDTYNLSHLRLPNGKLAEVTLVFATPGTQVADKPASQRPLVESLFDWAGALAYEDAITPEQFWEVMAQAPVFASKQPLPSLQSFEVTVFPQGIDPFSIKLLPPFNEPWSSFNIPPLQAGIKPDVTVFVEMQVAQDNGARSQIYGISWKIVDEAYFELMPRSGAEEIALQWGPVRFDLGKQFRHYSNDRLVWAGGEKEYSMVISREMAAQLLSVKPVLLIEGGTQGQKANVDLQCDQNKVSNYGELREITSAEGQSGNASKNMQALEAVRTCAGDGNQLLALGRKTDTGNLTGLRFRFYVSETGTATASTAPKTLSAALDMKITPNPARDYVTIALNLPQSCQGVLSVYNAAGQLVQRDERRWEAGEFSYTLQGERYLKTAGVYTAVLEIPQGKVSRTFVVEKH